MKLHVRYAMRHLFLGCLFLMGCLTARAAELERFSLDEWKAYSRKLAEAGRITDFSREFEEWLSSHSRMKPDELVALLDNPVIAMAAGQAELASAYPLELGKASRSTDGGREFLADVFSDPDWVDSFLLAGRLPLKTGDGFSIAGRLWKEDQKLHADPLWHRVLTALILESASLDGVKNGTEDRFRLLKEAHDKGKLYDRFNTLNVWEMRFVVGATMSNADMTWVWQKGDELQLDRKNAGSVGRAFGMVPYRLTNNRGVSIQTSGFYDGKPVTMQLLTEYGAVCGGISRFGTNFCLASGIPAFTMGQAPDHCAFCWKPGDNWAIGNDVHGWASSQISPIYDGWGGEGVQIFLADALISKSKNYPLSHKILWLGKLRNRPTESNEFAKLAVAKESLDFNAWLILARQYNKSGMQVAKKDPALELLVNAVNALNAHPAMLGIWFGAAGEGIVAEVDKMPEAQERGGNFFIAKTLATQCPKASIMPILQSLVRIRLREIKQEGRFDAFQSGNTAAFYADMTKGHEWKLKQMFKEIEEATEGKPSISAFFKRFNEPIPTIPKTHKVRKIRMADKPETLKKG